MFCRNFKPKYKKLLYLHLSSKFLPKSFFSPPFSMNGIIIHPTAQARNPKAILDPSLSYTPLSNIKSYIFIIVYLDPPNPVSLNLISLSQKSLWSLSSTIFPVPSITSTTICNVTFICLSLYNFFLSCWLNFKEIKTLTALFTNAYPTPGKWMLISIC